MLSLSRAIFTILRKPGFTDMERCINKIHQTWFTCDIGLSVYQDKISLSSIKSTFDAKTLHCQSINLVYHDKPTLSRVYLKFI